MRKVITINKANERRNKRKKKREGLRFHFAAQHYAEAITLQGR